MTLSVLQFTVLPALVGVLAWLAWRCRGLDKMTPRLSFVERELDRQSTHNRALAQVVKRHVQQSLQSRQQMRLIQRDMAALRSQTLQGQACDSAIALVRKGKDIKPLVKRGDLNSAEAHLIRLVHSSSSSNAANRSLTRPKSLPKSLS